MRNYVANEPSDQRTSPWGYAQVGDSLIAALVQELRNRQSAADQLEQQAADALGVHRTAARCLELLSRRGPLSAGELATGIGLTPSGTTPLLDRLERVGAIERVRGSGKDRRTITIELTAKGLAVAREVWDDLYEPIGKLAVDYRRSQLEFVVEFLQKANAILEGKPPVDAVETPAGAGPTTSTTTVSGTAEAPPQHVERPLPPVAKPEPPVEQPPQPIEKPEERVEPDLPVQNPPEPESAALGRWRPQRR